MTNRIIAVLIALILVCLSVPAFADGVLRVGMECGYAPYNWHQAAENAPYTARIADGSGYADGYDVQIAQRIAAYLGMELEIVKTEWDGLSMGVRNGAFDLIIAGMSPTESRKLTLDFSDPYYESQLVVVVRKDGPYANATSLDDLAGARIVGQLNTFHDTVIDQIPGVVHMTPMETFPNMIIAARFGSVDGYVAERPGAQADTTANPDLTYIEFAEGKGFVASEADTSIAVGMKKGSELLSQVNEALAQITLEEREALMEGAKARQPLAN